MSDVVFKRLLESLEKRDQELGRTSPSVTLQCDSRYWQLAGVIRKQLGKTSSDDGTSNARASTSNRQSRTTRKSRPISSASPSSQRRDDIDIAQPKPGYASLPTQNEDTELIDLLDDDVVVAEPKKTIGSTTNDMPRRIPRLFGDDEDETMVLDPSSSSQQQRKQLSQEEEITQGRGKRKAVEPNKSPKRRRSKKPPKEARGDRYRPAPAKWVLERMQRHTQRLCLVRTESRGEEGMLLDVMGTNGNVYKVVIGLHPTCTCMDFTGRAEKGKNGPCKHLIFAFLRVFKLEREDPRWWQTRLVPSELKDLLERRPAHLGEGVMAEERVQSQFAAMSSQDSNVRRTLEGDCPVCFEDLVEADGARPEGVTSFCKKCGHNFHKLCLDNWINAQNGTPTCPLCRQTLQADEAGKEEGHVNLAAYSTAHERQLTLAEMYRDTHQYIGRGGRGRRRGRGGHRESGVT